jgi:nucleoside-diphosphate-sugar epimerase
LASHPKAIGGAWNIGNERPEYRIMEVAEIVRGAVGRDVVLVPAADTPGSPVRRCPAMANTEALTGYHRRRSLEEGVALTHHWYQQHWTESGTS